MSAEITQGTSEAVALQDAIQRELIQRTYSTEGDNVMAEFVFVMLCNQKTPDQITNELQELIGPEFEPSFTAWLFDTVAQHYPNSKAAQHSTAKKASAQQPTAPPANLPARPSPFGNVAAGIKRGHTESFSNGRSGSAGPPSQRPRTDLPDHVPRGPRNPQPTDGDPSLGPPKRSLQDRMGPPPGFFPAMTPMGPMFVNPQTGQGMPAPPEAMEQFANGGVGGDQQSGERGQRNQRGRGRGRGRDNNRRGEQGQQQQQQPMMLPPGGMPMFFAPGPNGQPQPFFPPPQQMFPFQQPGMPGFPPQMQPQPQQQQPPQLPAKPTESGLCKYATECKNAYCKFAHPTPAASKDSGMVLSNEVCDKQLACEDADCTKSHVSPQQKDPAGSRPPPGSEQVAQPFPQQMQQQQQHFGGQAGAKPCKFGASCTRPDCMFQHPWNNATPCRFGAGCTRPDCYFSHPPGRKRGGARGGYANKGNRTAVFNTQSTDKSVEQKLEETEAEKQALNERMKRFSGPDAAGNEGQPQQDAADGASAAEVSAEVKAQE